MKTYTEKLFRIGDQVVVTIPDEILKIMHLRAGMEVIMEVRDKKVIIYPKKEI